MIEFITEHYILTFILFFVVIITIDNMVGNICKMIAIAFTKGDNERK